MPNKASILSAMQYSYFASSGPLHSSYGPRQTITYQYAGTSQPGDLPTGTTYSGWTNFSTAEKAGFEAALAHIETFLNVRFVEVSGSSDPDLNVGKVTLAGSVIGQGGYGIRWSSVSGTEWDGFVVYDNTLNLSAPAQMSLMLHELGHSLGLKHPFSGSNPLPPAFDSNKYTVMSYDSNPDNGVRSDAMMLYDVYSLQDIWGKAAFNAGDTNYTGPRTNTVDTIWDTRGTDALDASGYSSGVRLELRPGVFSQFGTYPDVVIGFGTKIENAIGGAGADVLIGSWLNNRMDGGQGSDTIKAGRGDDVLNGQQGTDILDGQDGNDLLTGGSEKDILFGGAGNDTLRGGTGNDLLYGFGGADTLEGGAGGDKFIFKPQYGTDTITDFTDGIDRIKFIGLGNKAQVLSHATETASDVVFDFGGGDVLTVQNMTIALISDEILT